MLKSVKVVSSPASSTSLPECRPLFYHINRYATKPVTRIALSAALPDQIKWLQSCLDLINLTGIFYLFIPNFAGGWHWMDVEASQSEEWITELISRTDVNDFMVLSHDGQGFVGVVEDEAAYLAFVYKNVDVLEINT